MQIIDDIDQHMTLAGSIGRAAVPPGFFLAWCANLQLLSDSFDRSARLALVRLRIRDITPGEFLVTACHGRFDGGLLNERGQKFVSNYYALQYLADFAATFAKAGPDDPALYDVPDDWAHYDQLAPVLTKRLYGPGPAEKPKQQPQRQTGKGGWLRLIVGGRKD